jgi:hypothetical protein
VYRAPVSPLGLMRHSLRDRPSEAMATPNSPLFRRLIFGICAALVLAFAVAVGMAIIAARTALIAENNLQALFQVHQATGEYIEQSNGQWPRSWNDLRALRPDTDFDWVAERVKIDFNANPRRIAGQTPGEFTAIVPDQPCFVYDDQVQSLIDTLKKYHHSRRAASE